MRVIEFYSGLGGAHLAFESFCHVNIIKAFDQSPYAIKTYCHNFPDNSVVEVKNLEDITSAEPSLQNSDFWWMSPPCQPYTKKGVQKDLNDPRALSFKNLLCLIQEIKPQFLALENVVGFQNSQAHNLLIKTLRSLSYQHKEYILCPTQIGIPNRRERFYLTATTHTEDFKTLNTHLVSEEKQKLSYYIQAESDRDETLCIPTKSYQKYSTGFRILERDDPHSYTTCFASSYGTAFMRSGAYLITPNKKVRFFSPKEILNFLGFPESYCFPTEIPLKAQWKLAGNSLSIEVVRRVLQTFPQLQET